MKKFFAILFSVLYLISSNACYAMVSKLYFVKDSSKDIAKPLIESELSKQKYILNQKDPYYAVLNKDNYVIIILQKSSENYFYYYLSNKNSKSNKSILKGLKSRNIVFEESFNNFYIGNFENQAQKILTNTMTTYDFDDKAYAQNQANQQATIQKKDDTVLKGYVGQVSKGSTFNVYLQSPINTATAQVGDTVTAVLTENWTYNGSVIAPQGSLVSGKLTKARHATYGSMNGRVVINFDNIRTPEGKSFNISTEKIDFTVSNEGKLTKTVQTVATSAIVGALAGLIIGALSGDSSIGSSVAIGAGVGAGGALVTSTAEQGVDAEIPTYTEMEITLQKPLNVILKY